MEKQVISLGYDPDPRKLTFYGEGGEVFATASLAMIGDGSHEVITPLADIKRVMEGGVSSGSITGSAYYGANVKPPSEITEDDVRRIVREEIAAQKERLFGECREYNSRVRLAAIEEYEASLRCESVNQTDGNIKRGRQPIRI